MPRTGKGSGRGGSRQGTPGTSYAQRTDLQQRKVPTMVGPSPQYGTAIAQQRALQAMPIAAPPSPPPAPAPSAAPAPQPITPLDAPTQRPGEHVLAGASVGPGPGPEALSVQPQTDPGLARLGVWLPVLELAASQPDSSPELRQMVRQIRGSLPAA